MRVRKVQEVNCPNLPGQLKDARRNADRSLLQICKRLDISPTYWYRLERGETETISYDLLQKIEQELPWDFGVYFPDSQRRHSKKGSQGMNLSSLQWIKAVTPPSDWPSYWAYTPDEIEKMKQSNNQVINHNEITIFPLAFKGEQSTKLESGDLIALTQHAKITHIVEVLDEQFFEVGGWSNRYVKIIWWKPKIDWNSPDLPHREKVLGVDVAPGNGNLFLFDSFKSFRDKWQRGDGLKEFQDFLSKKLIEI
jgi:transcriptional regulator with XRE-family HTH domain